MLLSPQTQQEVQGGGLPGAGGEVDPQIEGGAGTETGAPGGRVGEGLLVRTCSAQGPPSPVVGAFVGESVSVIL